MTRPRSRLRVLLWVGAASLATSALAIAAFVLVLRAKTLICISDPGIPGIRVSVSQGNDWLFGGPSAKSFELRIENALDSPLEGLEIILNESHRARFSAVKVDQGFWKGARPWGDGNLPPSTTVEIPASHDVNNQGIFRDAAGDGLPPSVAISSVRLRWRSGDAVWRFSGP
ncbi:MAG: hypothetical protein JXP34_27600 [Planctomycetes bacterium]|nr:hypothetical protein [Planctomycetota bacterium]